MWDKKYASPNSDIYGLNPNDFLKIFVEEYILNQDPSFKALDLGSGEGRNALFLLEKGMAVDCLEKSKLAMEKAKVKLKDWSSTTDFILGDVLNEEWKKSSYNLITSIWLHLPKGARLELYNKIDKALKPGGYFVLESFRKEQSFYGVGGPPTNKIMPDLAELNQAFTKFEILTAQEIDRELNEGPEHQGMAACIQFIIRKRKY